MLRLILVFVLLFIVLDVAFAFLPIDALIKVSNFFKNLNSKILSLFKKKPQVP